RQSRVQLHRRKQVRRYQTFYPSCLSKGYQTSPQTEFVKQDNIGLQQVSMEDALSCDELATLDLLKYPKEIAEKNLRQVIRFLVADALTQHVGDYARVKSSPTFFTF
ncbi:MAG: hypothetical protein ABIZ49_00895, partial [Opitutaceae bacterium]